MKTTNRTKYVWDRDAWKYVPMVAGPRERLHDWVVDKIERVRRITLLQVVVFIALVLRVVQLGKGAFWYDEGVTIVFARLPFDRMIQATAGDVHPPLYYILIWLIARVGIPLSEWVARFPSMGFSLIGVWLTWKLVNHRTVRLTKVGRLVVIAWVVISPLQLHYAQEARMYSLFQIEVLAGILAVLERRKIVLSAILLTMLYTHNYAVFYIPTMAVVAYIWEYGKYLGTLKPIWIAGGIGIKLSMKGYIKNWLAWFIIPVLLWVPWFIVLAGQMGTVSGGYWIQPVKPASVLFVLYQMLFAYSMPPTFQGLGVLLTCGVLLYTGFRVYKDRPPEWLAFVVLSFLPLVLSVIVSVVWKPVLLFRGLIGTAVPLTILVVKAVESIKVPYKKVYAYALIGTTLIAGVIGHYKFNAVNKGETTTWVHGVVSRMEKGDVILALNDNGIIAMKTYAPGVPVYKLVGCGEEPLGGLSEQTRQAIGVEERAVGELIPEVPGIPNAGPSIPLQKYVRIYFISTIAPVSPQCEIDQANAIISREGVVLLESLSNTEYAQAGVYLIPPVGEIY